MAVIVLGMARVCAMCSVQIIVQRHPLRGGAVLF